MFDNFNNSPDSRFLADIHAIAENTAAIAHSLALVAGILAKREGIPCSSVSANPRPEQPSAPSAANSDPLTPTDTEPLADAIAEAYEIPH